MLLRTLGGLALEGARFRRPKPLLLLAYLSLEGPKERRYLAELFWKEAVDPRQSLSVALSQIRAGIPDAVDSGGPIIRSKLPCDANNLLEAASRGTLAQALEYYRGEFLLGVDVGRSVELEEWLYGTREYINLRVKGLLVEAAVDAAQAGDRAEATRLGERAALLDTGSKELEPEVVAHLHELLRWLHSPLAGVVPSAAEGTPLRLRLPAGSQDDRGSQGKQVAHDGKTTPESALSPVFGENLPRLATSLIGRETELHELRQLMDQGVRLLTLTGLGGMGKTRLALALAQDQLERGLFDGTYFIQLSGVTDASYIPGRIASALGLSTQPGQDQFEALVSSLRGRRFMLVLDNFEQLVHGSGILLDLLHACPGLTLVFTSREPLGVAEESLYPVGGLSLPSGDEFDPENGDSYGGLLLFEDRARRIAPDFRLDEHNRREVLEICTLLDGSPLGIELAAALVQVLSPRELLDAIADNLDVLESHERNREDRHASLRAVFEHTWLLLPQPEREALRRIVVFKGGFRRQAGAQVAGMSIPILASLVDRSLLRRRQGRFDVHRLVRIFAAEKLALDPQEEEEVRERHANYYAELLASQQGVESIDGQRRIFAEIMEDLDNVRVAWQAAVVGNRADLLERMARPLARFLNDAGMHGELASLLDSALERLKGDSLARARLLHLRAYLSDDEEFAYRAAQQVLDLSRRFGSDTDVAEALQELGRRCILRGENDQARELLQDALQIFRREGMKSRVVACLTDLAPLSDDAWESLRLYEEAYRLGRTEGDTSTRSLESMAQFIATALGDYERSVGLIEEAILLERAVGGPAFRLSSLLSSAAFLYLHMGDVDTAQGYLAEAGSLLEGEDDEEVGALQREMNCCRAVLHYVRGEVEAAVEAARRHERHNKSLPMNLLLLMRLALDTGDDMAVNRLMRQVGELAHGNAGRVSRLWWAHWHLFTAEMKSPDPSSAREHLATALLLARDHVFVPVALDAFVTATKVPGTDSMDEVLNVAASHPGASCFTRVRASAAVRAAGVARSKRILDVHSLLRMAGDLAGRMRAS